MFDLKSLRGMLFSGASMLPMLGSLGCTHFCYEVGYTGRRIAEHTGHDDWQYYHSPKSGEIVAKRHHRLCGQWCEPPFFGYEPTCWSQWPEGYMGCPPMLEQPEVQAPQDNAPVPQAPPADPAPEPMTKLVPRNPPAANGPKANPPATISQETARREDSASKSPPVELPAKPGADKPAGKASSTAAQAAPATQPTSVAEPPPKETQKPAANAASLAGQEAVGTQNHPAKPDASPARWKLLTPPHRALGTLLSRRPAADVHDSLIPPNEPSGNAHLSDTDHNPASEASPSAARHSQSPAAHSQSAAPQAHSSGGESGKTAAAHGPAAPAEYEKSLEIRTTGEQIGAVKLSAWLAAEDAGRVIPMCRWLDDADSGERAAGSNTAAVRR